MPTLWAAVDEAGKAFRLAEAGGRRIKAGRLVAPGRIEGIFGDRQELDMGEAHVDAIGDQPVGKLVPGEHVAIVAALPGAGMNLVDRDRLAARVDACPMRPVRLVLPVLVDLGRVVIEAVFGRSSERRAKGSAFSGSNYAVLADGSRICRSAPAWMSGTKISQMPVSWPQPHDVAPAVPVVEIADDGDAPGIRRPDGEMEAFGAVMLDADGRPSCRTAADASPRGCNSRPSVRARGRSCRDR